MFFALALVLVACAIGSVAWNCIEGLNRHSQKVHLITSTTKDLPVSVAEPKLTSAMDERIYAGKEDPMAAIQEQPPEGSAVPFMKGMDAVSKKQYHIAAADFSQALVMIPVEAGHKTSWQVGQTI